MITLNQISLRRGTRVLFSDANWTIFHKQRIGIIGANGSGKSSLFALLLGQLEAEQGNLYLPANLTLAHVAQETPSSEQSALEFVLTGDQELMQLYDQLNIAEQQNNGKKIAEIHGRLAEIDAYTASARAGQLLNGLGFAFQDQQKPVKAFSGGWRVRLNLAKALMCRSDVLLLDEPTNHLDLDAIMWLETWLLKYQGTLLVISHDRDFLDKVVGHILYISNQQLKLYTGHYSSFEKQRAEQLRLQQANYEKQQREIAHLQSFINRFKAKASKAKQAQSRVKALERMELVAALHADSPFKFAFKEPDKSPNPLISLQHVTLNYSDKNIFSNLNFSIGPQDRIALLGPNGVGKTSLIKLLAGSLTPIEGDRVISDGVRIGFFAQHQIDTLDLQSTPLEHLRQLAPNVKELVLRQFLGQFDFRGDRIFDVIQHFSGGEKSRLALALLIWQRPNLLLLDEPTNHLDLEMREALSIALQSYQGAMVLVSHDRFLVKTTADQLMLVSKGQVQPFEGSLKDYQKWLLQSSRQVDSETRVHQPQDTQKRARKKSFIQQLKKVELKLENLQSKMKRIETELANHPYEENNQARLQDLLHQQAELMQEIELTETDWLQMTEQLSNQN